MQLAATQHNTVDRLFGWWYAIAAPSAPAANASPHTREVVRIGRFTSLILLLEFIISIPAYFSSSDPHLIVPLSITIGILCVGLLLNRKGHTRAAGILIVLVMECGMCFFIVSLGFTGGGLAPETLMAFDILMQPVLIAVSLFPARGALSLAGFNCLFSAAALAFLPKTPELAQYISIPHSPLSYFTPAINQLFVALISVLWVTSARQEMRRADHAEEVNRLVEALAAQQQSALLEKQQLEESIRQIVAVHVQVTNGDLDARVPLNQKNVLWSIAGSLNTLLARLQYWRQEALQGQRTEQAIRLVLHDLQQARKAGVAFYPRKTKSALDPLLAEIATMSRGAAQKPPNTPYPHRPG